MKSQNITNFTQSPTKRAYQDACGAAHALDLVGERWALLVMRELMLGPKRFSDLRADLPGISANVLTQRLGGLEAAGVLVRRRLPPPTSAQVYELTPWGYESEPIFQVLGRWAARSPGHDPTLPLSAVSLLLSLRTMIDPALARDMTGTIGLRLGDEAFVVSLAGGKVEAVRGDPSGSDLLITGTAATVAAAVYGGVPLTHLEEQGSLKIEGDRRLAERFVHLFPLPTKVATAREA